LKFRRQHALGPFIADFYCAEYRLVIDVDGYIHDGSISDDKSRTKHLEAYGYRVIRFRNEEIQNHLDQVLKTIQDTCAKPTHPINHFHINSLTVILQNFLDQA
jgi:very-short-patch-repair endonuclease